MQKEFVNRLKRARRRLVANLLLEALAAAILVAGVAAAVAVLLERTLAVPILAYPLAAGLAGLVALWLLAAWLMQRPTVPQAALAIDERMALKERFSTALALAASEDPFAVAAREETYARAATVQVQRHFPVRPGRRWIYAGSTWAAVVLVALLVPNMDLLGRRAEAEHLAAEQAKARQAAVEVQQKVAKVEALVKQLNDPTLAADLAKLPEFKPEVQTPEVNREALRKMTEFSDKLQNMTEGERADAEKMLDKMLRQMKLPTQGLSKKLGTALAHGKFGEAAQALAEMKKELEAGKMSSEDKAAIEKELAKIADQLKELAAQQKELENALADAGLSKDLAQLSPQDLQKALQQAGLSSETIQKLLDKQQASLTACQNASALAKALAKCAGSGQGVSGQGLSADGMAALGDELDQLEAMRQQLAMARAALDELKAGMGLLGCQLGGESDFAFGLSDHSGAGTGGPGRGFGPRETSVAEATNNTGTRVANRAAEGPIIATWSVQEDQIKGESKAKFQETLEAARDRAADAISDNTIPSRYHGPLKEYFDQLNSVRKPDAPQAIISRPRAACRSILTAVGLFGLMAAAAAATGCRDSAPTGEVVVYCSVDEDVAAPILADFEKSSGLHIVARYDSESGKTTGLAQKLRTEAPHPSPTCTGRAKSSTPSAWPATARWNPSNPSGSRPGRRAWPTPRADGTVSGCGPAWWVTTRAA